MALLGKKDCLDAKGWEEKGGRRRTYKGFMGEGGMSYMVFSSGEFWPEEEMRELVPSVFLAFSSFHY